MIKFYFDFSQPNKLSQTINSIEQELNLRGTEQDIERVIGREETNLFATRGASGGSLWEALADGSNDPPLVDSGALREAMTHPEVELEDNGRRIVTRFSGEHAELGPLHQKGFTIKRKTKRGVKEIKVKPRKVVQVTDAMVSEIQQIAFNRIVDGIGKKLKIRK